MATDLGYQVNTQYPTVEFLGGTQTQDVVAVGITTNGHGVYLEFRIPRSQYNAQQVKDYATGYTGTVEQFFAIPGIVDEQWSQQPNAGGNLVDTLTFTVQSDSGNSAATFSLPLAQATTDAVTKQAAALRSELNSAETGSS